MDLLKEIEEKGVPHFAYDKIVAVDQSMINEVKEFAKTWFWSDCHSVNIFDVKGTRHMAYQGMTWLELLQKGSRMENNLRLLKENPIYYDEAINKQPVMYYNKIDDLMYLDGDGNHRTCLARNYYYFAGKPPVIHGIMYNDYQIDHEFKMAYTELCDCFDRETEKNTGLSKHIQNIKCKHIAENVKREDAPGWHREFYKHKAHLKFPSGKDLELTTEEIYDFLNNSSNILKKMFGKNWKFWW